MSDTPTAETAAFRLEDFLPYRLSVAANRVSRAFARRYAEEFGLTIPEWRVLAVVGDGPPVSAAEIVLRTAMDKAKVSRAVAGLLDRDLLRRAVNPLDQRRHMLAHSRKGRQIYETIVPRALALQAEVMQELSEEERRLLASLLDRLTRQATLLDGDEPGPDPE
jgi:DNA-binding MarR family transcriptional regulator